MDTILNSKEMAELLSLVEEAARSTEEGIKRFIEPAQGTLRRATTKRHHIIFGRRGSGKSSLLRKAAADLTVDRRPIAYVNLEAFKSHSYPDVLLSVLISTFAEFEQWLRTAAIHPANKKTFWQKLFGTNPSRPAFNKNDAERLAKDFEKEIQALKDQLHSADDVATTTSTKQASGYKSDGNLSGELGTTAAKVKTTLSETDSESAERENKEEYTKSKIDFLHRHILDYQKLFRRFSELSSGDSFLFLDDLYHIRRLDQHQLVDYFHRIAKDNHLWLKIGTIRHRSSWYIHGNPPIGLKLGDDADEIDLDLTLEKYSLAKEFLTKILKGFVDECHELPYLKF